MILGTQDGCPNAEATDQTGLRLDGKAGLIAGGGRGIGRAIALSLARRGMSVAVLSRSPADLNHTVSLIEDSGGRAAAWPADAGDHRSIAAVVGLVERELGPIDLLVNAAGGISAPGHITEIEPEAWWHDVEHNLRTAFVMSWATLPGMMERKRGRIINIISNSAQRPHGHGGSGYAAAKAGVLNLTLSLAAEGAPSRVRAFAIDPGMVRTELTRRLIGSALWKRAFEARGRMPRWTRVERTQQMCVAIALGRADRLSGRCITVSDSLPDIGWRLLAALGTLRGDVQTMMLRRCWPGPEKVGVASVAFVASGAPSIVEQSSSPNSLLADRVNLAR